MPLLIEVIGWIAAVLILLAYGLLSTGRLAPNSQAYQWINIVGAAGFIVNSGWNGAYPSAGLNVAWMAIGFYALWKAKAAH